MSLEWDKGLQALVGGHSKSILDKAVSQSCDIDKQFEKAEPNEHRWDYVIERKPANGDSRTAAGVEVHGASTGEVKVIVAKKQWAEQKVADEESDLLMTKWWWVPTAGVSFTKTTKYARMLAKHGIEFPSKAIRNL